MNNKPGEIQSSKKRHPTLRGFFHQLGEGTPLALICQSNCKKVKRGQTLSRVISRDVSIRDCRCFVCSGEFDVSIVFFTSICIERGLIERFRGSHLQRHLQKPTSILRFSINGSPLSFHLFKAHFIINVARRLTTSTWKTFSR